MLGCSKAFGRLALEQDADIYHFHDPELIFTGLYLKRHGKKVVYDVHEDVPRQILNKPWLRPFVRKRTAAVFERMENHCAKRFDLIVAATPVIAERFQKINPQTIAVNNYPILAEFPYSKDAGQPRRDTVCYLGGITKVRGIAEMVDAAEYLNGELLLGGSFETDELRRETEQRKGYEKTRYLGFLNRKQVSELLSETAAGLVVLHPIPNYLVSLPIKMFEYMAAGLPVVASDFPYWREIVEKGQCGILVDPMDPKGIAAAVNELFADSQRAREMGENGRRLVEQTYNWEQEAEKLLHAYQWLSKQPVRRKGASSRHPEQGGAVKESISSNGNIQTQKESVSNAGNIQTQKESISNVGSTQSQKESPSSAGNIQRQKEQLNHTAADLSDEQLRKTRYIRAQDISVQTGPKQRTAAGTRKQNTMTTGAGGRTMQRIKTPHIHAQKAHSHEPGQREAEPDTMPEKDKKASQKSGMSIIIINHYAGSEELGMEFRPYYLGRELAKLGHEVTVVAATFSHLRRKNPQIDEDFSEQMMDGVRYVWVKTPAYRRNDQNRILNMVTFAQKLKRHAGQLARKYHPDAVVASSTYPFDIYGAKRVADAAGGRLYFEIHDLWPLSPIELYGFGERNPMIKYLQRAEDFAFQNAQKIISVLPHADRHIAERGKDPSKFVYIPNGVPLRASVCAEAEPYRQLLQEQRERGKFIVMYLGGFAKANALEEFVEASVQVGEDVCLVMIGDGAYKDALRKRAQELGSGNLLILDPVPKRLVNAVLKLADVLYIGAKRCSLYRYGVGMNKLYDYMLAAKPIICGVEASNDVVGDAACGMTIEPENARAIADAVKLFKKMSPNELEQFGKNAYHYVMCNHDYAVLAQRFADALEG